MNFRSTFWLNSLVAVIAVPLLAACSFAEDEDQVRVTVIEDGSTHINPVGTRLTFASSTMRAAMAKGLVGLDEDGRVVPALAARWIVSEDGLSYIFRLFDAKWDDGRQITAERVARLLRSRFSELRKSRLQYDVSVVDEVVSMTGRVIEIRLDSPHPNFLQLLAQPEMGLFRAGHGAGPMRLLNEENGIKLNRFDEPSQEEDEEEAEQEDDRWVSLRSESAAAAIARYRAGGAQVVLNGKYHHLPLVDAADISSSDLRLDPVAGLFGLRFIRAEGFWAVPGNREILAMAINRPALLTSFPGVSAWQSRLKIIPEALDVEGINTYPDWASMTMEARTAFAKNHVARWKASEGRITPLTIALSDAAGADILFKRIQSDLRRVGLNARRVGLGKNADVELMDEIAPYDSAQWFLKQFTCAQTPVCLNDADAKIAEADAATNLQIKARLYAEIEKILVEHYNFIPIAVPIRWSLAKQGQRGFSVNARGWHPLNPLVGIPIS
ncbi:ABC transporter substrate-binding protein [uncultured Parasphingorhabdus sp.]|uniref:ABC transporter substrate-binding protein n=1 Tax=uncultured Parasphingorhabdus sp. TaxID=2709694 RepID=UPI0030D87AF4|tara:strand:- start:26598 stop:28088 length:1491 start_codon:yes stop_codon:yes gene_type:complete